MTQTVRQRVGLGDIARGLRAFGPGLGLVARQAPALLARRPTHRISIGAVFQDMAARRPERVFVRDPQQTLTYGAANAEVNRYAAYLSDRGVRRGDVVGLLGHNDAQYLLLLLATVKLGAVAGLLNYNQRGEVLAHSLGVLDARLVVVADDLQEALGTAGEAAAAQPVVTLGELRAAAAGMDAANPAITAELVGSDKALYIFTSGTTGMPKASIMSHFRWARSYSGMGGLGVRLRPDDTLYCALPLYHNNAVTVALGAVLVAGASIAIAPKFTASRFWEECIAYDATAFVYIGEFCRYLLGQPAKPTDRQHRVRVIVGNGLRPDIWAQFQQRFGIERIAEFYGASECNIAFINVLNIDQTAGTCPLPHKVVAYDPDTGAPQRDARGRVRPVKTGEVGLLLAVVNDRVPFDGYTDDGATQAKLVRDALKPGDCWFNTGDLVRKQGFQHVAFVDRLGDTFRWKGENVATTQVEAALAGVDWVQEGTVYGVDVPGTDGKAGMAALVVAEGRAFDGVALADQVRRELPVYAWPVFVRLLPALEHTSTFKSRKVEVRDAGYGPGDGPVHVLTQDGYLPFYDGYLEELAAGRMPR